MKVPIVYQGETIEELELPDGTTEETVKKIQEGYQKGVHYDKKMHTLSEQEKELAVKMAEAEKINQLIDKAKEDDEFFSSQFVPTLEGILGRPLTKKEEENLLEPDLKDNPIVRQLNEKIDKLSKMVERDQESQIFKEINATHADLEKKYNGKDGMPKYDREQVEKFITDKKFFLPDVNENYEQAYFMANREKILEAERTRSERRRAVEDNDETKIDFGTDAPPLKPNVKAKNWDEVEDMAIKGLREKGLSINK